MSTAPTVVADAGPADIDWQELEARAHDDAHLSFGYLALMVMAAVLAAIAILTDSVVMLIGAMIVAPDFGPIAGVSIGATSRRWGRVAECATALVLGYGLAAVTGLVVTTIATSLGHVPLVGPTDLAVLIDEVSAIGFVAAAAAGLAGTISLVTSKSAAVVGVAVSITTISAATNVGIVLARGDWQDALGPLGALLFNLSALIGAGLVSFAAVHHVPWLRRRLAG